MSEASRDNRPPAFDIVEQGAVSAAHRGGLCRGAWSPVDRRRVSPGVEPVQRAVAAAEQPRGLQRPIIGALIDVREPDVFRENIVALDRRRNEYYACDTRSVVYRLCNDRAAVGVSYAN